MNAHGLALLSAMNEVIDTLTVKRAGLRGSDDAQFWYLTGKIEAYSTALRAIEGVVK